MSGATETQAAKGAKDKEAACLEEEVSRMEAEKCDSRIRQSSNPAQYGNHAQSLNVSHHDWFHFRNLSTKSDSREEVLNIFGSVRHSSVGHQHEGR